MTIYFISGLGADKRAFGKLKLPDNYIVKHIDWITPIENEPLENYALRLSKEIDTTHPFVIVGLSFGGIIATEISKILKPKLTVLISSIASKQFLPWYYKIIGLTFLDKLIPASILKKPSRLSFYFFGAKTIETKKLLTNIFHDTDEIFLKWAIRKIVTWKNIVVPTNLFHIHGSADKILPLRFLRADVEIKAGGHLMVFDKADQVSKILTERLGSL